MPTTEELQTKIEKLERELNELKGLFYKDSYSNLEIFRKKVQFKGGIAITDIEETGGTAPIADGDHVVTIPDGGGNITIVTINGIVTSIT
jgi:hypothetical protein